MSKTRVTLLFPNQSFLIIFLSPGTALLPPSRHQGLHHTFLPPCVPSTLTHTEHHTADYCSWEGLWVSPNPPARRPGISLRHSWMLPASPHCSPTQGVSCLFRVQFRYLLQLPACTSLKYFLGDIPMTVTKAGYLILLLWSLLKHNFNSIKSCSKGIPQAF